MNPIAREISNNILLKLKEEVDAIDPVKEIKEDEIIVENPIKKHDEKKEKFIKTKTEYATAGKGFLKLENDMLESLAQIDPGPATLYLYLRQHEVTWKKRVDEFNLYEDYYLKQGKICVSISGIVLGKIFNRDRKTIKKWIKKLENGGALKVIPIRKGKEGHCKTWNIYEIGYVEKVGNTMVKYYYRNGK